MRERAREGRGGAVERQERENIRERQAYRGREKDGKHCVRCLQADYLFKKCTDVISLNMWIKTKPSR